MGALSNLCLSLLEDKFKWGYLQPTIVTLFCDSQRLCQIQVGQWIEMRVPVENEELAIQVVTSATLDRPSVKIITRPTIKLIRWPDTALKNTTNFRRTMGVRLNNGAGSVHALLELGLDGYNTATGLPPHLARMCSRLVGKTDFVLAVVPGPLYRGDSKLQGWCAAATRSNPAEVTVVAASLEETDHSSSSLPAHPLLKAEFEQMARGPGTYYVTDTINAASIEKAMNEFTSTVQRSAAPFPMEEHPFTASLLVTLMESVPAGVATQTETIRWAPSTSAAWTGMAFRLGVSEAVPVEPRPPVYVEFNHHKRAPMLVRRTARRRPAASKRQPPRPRRSGSRSSRRTRRR